MSTGDAALTLVVGITIHRSHSLALKTGGSVWRWGANGAGQLGDGTPTARSPPVPVSGLSGARAAGGGDGHSLALGAVGQSQTTSYGYDRLSRLTSVTAPAGPTSYAYDPAGNRLSRTRGGSTTSYAYDRADRITTAGSVSYTVNANGNLTARGTDSFAYDQANRLTSATVGGTTSTYAYDGDGKRVSSTVGGTTTRAVYDVNAGLPVLLDDGTRKYVFGLGLAYAVDSGGGVEVYHTDGLGSVRAITDAAGTVIQTYQTDEFGIPTQTSGSSGQPFGYTGEPRDGETGFVYLRARMYDPAVGRFVQRDPFPGVMRSPLSLNRYSYVRNNPVKLIDPSGLYEYRYEWYIGSERIVGSPESVMAYFQAHPRAIFPFDLGQCDRIEINAQCDLATGPSNYAPVQVTAITSTSFTFTALPGHFDYNPQAPADSWIRFRIFKRDGAIYLEQKARALVDDRLVDFVAPKFAYLFAWAQQAQNLRKIFNPFYPAEPMPQAGA